MNKKYAFWEWVGHLLFGYESSGGMGWVLAGVELTSFTVAAMGLFWICAKQSW